MFCEINYWINTEIETGYKTGARYSQNACERLRSSTQASALVRKSEYCPVIRLTGLAVICNLSQNRSAINIRLRTVVNLVIFPLSVWPAHDISTFCKFNGLQYVPVYMVFHCGIAPISLV